MSVATLDQALDIIMQLSVEQQEMLLDILRRRQVELRRQEIAQDAQASRTEYRARRFRLQSAEEAITDLHKSLDLK
jgi:hypothetical protein